MTDLLQRAIQHHRAGELSQAESLYRAILQTQPNHPDANHNLGVIAVAMNKSELALPFFKLALETNPNQAQFWLSYIDALIKTKQFDLARAVLNQGKESFGLQGETVNALAALLPELYGTAIELREMGRFLEAIDWLKNYLVQNPQDANAYAHLAQNFSLNKQDDKAWTALNSALAINPNSILVQRNHARLLLKQQKFVEARKIAAGIYQADSADVENQLVFAAMLAANNELEPSKNLCEKALQVRPNYAEAFAILGQIHWKAGNKNAALQLFEKALSIKPHLTQLYPIVAGFHNENQNLSAAILVLQKALEYNQNEIHHMVDLGEFLCRNNQIQEAITILKKAVQLAPENVNAWMNLGTVLQQKSEFKKALIAYEKALVILPTCTRSMVNKASALHNLGRYEEAEKILLDTLEIDHSNVIALRNLGESFQSRNHLLEANIIYLKMIELKFDVDLTSLLLTINYYLLLDYSAAHEFLQLSLPTLNRPKLKEFKVVKNYVFYMSKLLDWWETKIKNTGLSFDEQNQGLPLLAVIGESHSLAAHRTNFEIQKKPHHCHAYWLGGIKMWHLAQTKSHLMKQCMVQILSKLPPDTSVMFTIGEIDCRLDEGIWSAAKKHSEDYRVVLEKTVCGYIDYLENALKNTAQRNIIIQGIPAPNYSLDEDENSSDDIVEFLKMVELVNQRLMFHTLAKGWQFLDVYAATALENGKSNQQWHLDGHHLSPSFYAQAEQWLKV
ncbi:MAG: tetratricopeptide repeat protein [Methylococcaceae bacterium]